MKRKFWRILEEWNNKDIKMPLMVIGARQVGKTYLIDKYCKENFNNYCYINLFEDKQLIEWFEKFSTFEQKLEILELTYNIKLSDKDTILFVDEVQESESFIEALKIFCEKGYTNIICAGSLLGVKLKRFKKSYPVGKVYEEYLYPMDFEEYLWAIGKERYIDSIRKSFLNNEECLFHDELMNEVYRFWYLGGMPAIIQNYITKGQNLSNIDSELIHNILNAYIRDMKKYNENSKENIRIERIYKNIPSQLAKVNQKFTYARIDKHDNRKRDYVTSLDWLISSCLVFPCYTINEVNYPLLAHIDDESYKLFLSDTGIICNMVGINGTNILSDGDYDFKGVVAENYVAMELVKQGRELYYWSRKNDNTGTSEVDFVIQQNNGVIPIEVKAGSKVKSKSLDIYNDKFNPELMIRISAKNFGVKDNLKSIPLYAVFCLDLLDKIY